MRYLSILLLSISILFGCKVSQQTADDKQLEKLTKLMTGSFNSAKQARKDTNYYNISLQMYPIWEADEGAKWLYVEQAEQKTPRLPYRQRVYKLQKVGSDLYQSVVYTLPQPKRFIGKWDNPEFFNRISPDSLMLREGCAVYLRKVSEEYYRGETKDGTCKSTMRGATFALSEVEIFADKVISWDRGFNDEKEQVWGATQGGYIFNRINSK